VCVLLQNGKHSISVNFPQVCTRNTLIVHFIKLDKINVSISDFSEKNNMRHRPNIYLKDSGKIYETDKNCFNY